MRRMEKQRAPRASRPNMPGYGIVGEHEGDGLLAWSWAAERLERARNYFLSTTRPDGRPHVMVVWGLWLDDAFVFSTGRTSRKAQNLAANARCVVCPDDADEAVIVEAVAAELTDRATLERFAAAYQKKYGYDVSGMNEPVFIARPRVVFGQIEKTFTKSATRWTFEPEAE
jgi:pyridoxine/pyridoxamine 5'-phosphate oxidase